MEIGIAEIFVWVVCLISLMLSIGQTIQVRRQGKKIREALKEHALR